MIETFGMSEKRMTESLRNYIEGNDMSIYRFKDLIKRCLKIGNYELDLGAEELVLFDDERKMMIVYCISKDLEQYIIAQGPGWKSDAIKIKELEEHERADKIIARCDAEHMLYYLERIEIEEQ